MVKEVEEHIDIVEIGTPVVILILESPKIFVAGASRSGIYGKIFRDENDAHPINAFVVGETVTANLEKDDLLIIGSGSGETKTLVSIA